MKKKKKKKKKKNYYSKVLWTTKPHQNESL